METAPYKYTVVDLAVVPELTPVMRHQLRSVALPLLSQRAPDPVLDVGPWVVRHTKASDLAAQIDALATHLAWGFFVFTSVDLVSVRHTLRRFNLATLPDRKRPVLFRYWDPRVMATFLEVATPEQRARFFEFIDRVEAPDGSFNARRED